MADWRDRYQPGSFRGVPFVSRRHDGDIGRRGEQNQYPYRDPPNFEDLGRKADGWKLQAFVIGPDYMDARDALITALKGKGPGTLVHPWLGTFQAQLVDATFSESTDEGGMAVFDMQFAEPGELVTALATADTQAKAKDTAEATNAAASARFTNGFKADGEPPFVDDSAARDTDTLADAIGAAGDPLGGSGDGLQAFQDAMDAIADGMALIREPLALATAVIAAIGALSQLGDRPAAQVVALQGLIGSANALPAINATTPSRAIEASNRQALVDLVTAAAAGAAVRAGADATFTSYDDAIALRDGLGAALDAQALAAAGRFADDLAADLDALRRVMIDDVTARGGSLARLFTYTPPIVSPAVVIAWRLYGDPTSTIDQAAEIVARNRVAHPGFVPAVPLAVLTATGGANG